MVHPGLWVTCSHGVTHIQGSVFILGYGSRGVMAQGPTFGPLGPPVPSQEEINALQHRPAPPLFNPNFSPHPPVPPMSPYHSTPQCLTCSPHLAFSRTAFCSCRLRAHILPCAYIPLSLPHTPRAPYLLQDLLRPGTPPPQPTWDLIEPRSPQQPPLSLHWAPTEPPHIFPWTSLTPLRSPLGSHRPPQSQTGPRSLSQDVHSPPGAPLHPRILPDPIQQEGNAELAKV